MVEPEQSAQSLVALDWPVAGCGVGRVLREEQAVVFPLMCPLMMVVFDVLRDGVLKRGFAEEDHAVETFRVGVGIEPMPLPPRSPNLNAFAERFVKSIKDESRNPGRHSGQL
jgi:hypothetical protein